MACDPAYREHGITRVVVGDECADLSRSLVSSPLADSRQAHVAAAQERCTWGTEADANAYVQGPTMV